MEDELAGLNIETLYHYLQRPGLMVKEPMAVRQGIILRLRKSVQDRINNTDSRLQILELRPPLELMEELKAQAASHPTSGGYNDAKDLEYQRLEAVVRLNWVIGSLKDERLVRDTREKKSRELKELDMILKQAAVSIGRVDGERA